MQGENIGKTGGQSPVLVHWSRHKERSPAAMTMTGPCNLECGAAAGRSSSASLLGGRTHTGPRGLTTQEKDTIGQGAGQRSKQTHSARCADRTTTENRTHLLLLNGGPGTMSIITGSVCGGDL